MEDCERKRAEFYRFRKKPHSPNLLFEIPKDQWWITKVSFYFMDASGTIKD